MCCFTGFKIIFAPSYALRNSTSLHSQAGDTTLTDSLLAGQVGDTVAQLKQEAVGSPDGLSNVVEMCKSQSQLKRITNHLTDKYHSLLCTSTLYHL